MMAEYRNWQEEFVGVNFVDQRLKTRFFKIMDAFAASPGKSTWAATRFRSSAKVAYRFFSNTDISKDGLLDGISRATVEKMKCRMQSESYLFRILHLLDLETEKQSKGWDTIAARSKEGCWCIRVLQRQIKGSLWGFSIRKRIQENSGRTIPEQKNKNVPGQ
jgi:hypothetical protein